VSSRRYVMKMRDMSDLLQVCGDDWRELRERWLILTRGDHQDDCAIKTAVA
jgi:hypothetical protein